MLLFAHMLVVALPRLIVITQDAGAINHQGQPVLEGVAAARKRGGETPDDHLDKGRFGNWVSFVQQQYGSHVGDDNNTRVCCQVVQRYNSKTLPLFCDAVYWPPALELCGWEKQMQLGHGFMGNAAEIPVQVRSGGNLWGVSRGMLWRVSGKGKGRGESPGLKCQVNVVT